MTLLVVSPNSIRAGYQIEIRATCLDNVNPAYVSSRAFGSMTLEPDHGVLADQVVIPAGTASGTYTVSLSCASGGRSSATLTVLDGAHPNTHHGPDTGGGEMGSLSAAHLVMAGGAGAILAGLGIALASSARRRAVRG